MEWKNTHCQSVRDVILRNTGLTIESLQQGGTPIRHLDAAVRFVKNILRQNRPVKIMGDYDCDGVCGTTILYLALEEYRTRSGSASPLSARFPRRFSEGYGLSVKVVDETEKGLLLCVDNGIAAHDAIAKAKEKGLDVVMLDHHLLRGTPPPADVIVDPHVDADPDAFRDFCGAHLAYRFAELLLPDDPVLLDQLAVFAGIATVADVMPIIKDNWQIVRRSLDLLHCHVATAGLSALIRAMNIEYAYEEDYGFKLAPAINACGRLYDDGPKIAFQLLKRRTGDQKELEAQAAQLVQINEERKTLAKNCVDKAESLLQKDPPKRSIVLFDPGYHEGINGIVAGRLAEAYRMPAIVFSPAGKPGVMKGSGRTYGDLNLKALLDETSRWYLGYGGHAGAAGLSARIGDLQAIRDALDAIIPEPTKEEPVLQYDLTLNESDVEAALDELDRYRPFGEGNPAPVYRLNHFQLSPQSGGFFRMMGENQEHMKLFGRTMDAVLFGNAELYKENGFPMTMDLVGYLSRNAFAGKFSSQIEILDMKPVETRKTQTYKAFADLLTFS